MRGALIKTPNEWNSFHQSPQIPTRVMADTLDWEPHLSGFSFSRFQFCLKLVAVQASRSLPGQNMSILGANLQRYSVNLYHFTLSSLSPKITDSIIPTDSSWVCCAIFAWKSFSPFIRAKRGVSLPQFRSPCFISNWPVDTPYPV